MVGGNHECEHAPDARERVISKNTFAVSNVLLFKFPIMICIKSKHHISVIEYHFWQFAIDLANLAVSQRERAKPPIVILTSLVKFNSYFKVISKVFLHKNEQVVGCTSPLSLLRLVRAVCRVSVCSSSFTAASWTNVFNMKGRRPSTRSTSSRASLADSTGRKMLSEVLLVCELMMFITLSALTGGTPQLASTDSQKKQPKVCF